ncbi:uncharacterized protein LOC110990157 [Acanthaster planci]|uniref:Uncharacterized protein LOC110990157 n=1 Tax=Acanthaster planci TaxID=133434 RepID=A0A8B8A028_ACAPL|nr:uncharacterized protein LOC110990157 [Acanthaster planci]
MDTYLTSTRKLLRRAYYQVSKLTLRPYGWLRTLPIRRTAAAVGTFAPCRQRQEHFELGKNDLSVGCCSQVGEESAEESDWSSEDEGSASRRVRNDGGHRKARRNRSRRDRKQKDAKLDEKQKVSKPPEEKQENTATPAPSAPVTRLAEVLSSKEGLKSAALKSTARDNSNAKDEAEGKVSEEVHSDSTTIIKIKPPPTAPKPRAKRTNSTKSSDGMEDKPGESRNCKAAEDKNTDEVTATFGPVDDNIFDGMEITKPKLTSYKRTMGPQGRRLPQRYSNQVQSQRFSNQSTNSLAAVSA